MSRSLEMEEVEELTSRQLRQLHMEGAEDDSVYSSTGIAVQEEEDDSLDPQDAWWCIGYLDEE